MKLLDIKLVFYLYILVKFNLVTNLNHLIPINYPLNMAMRKFQMVIQLMYLQLKVHNIIHKDPLVFSLNPIILFQMVLL